MGRPGLPGRHGDGLEGLLLEVPHPNGPVPASADKVAAIRIERDRRDRQRMSIEVEDLLLLLRVPPDEIPVVVTAGNLFAVGAKGYATDRSAMTFLVVLEGEKFL